MSTNLLDPQATTAGPHRHRSGGERSTAPDPALAHPAAVWPLIRLSLATTFLWAFADKLLALGFATGRDDAGTAHILGSAAWIKGGSPTKGYLSFAAEGPLAGLAHDLAGVPVIDWLFMLGLLGVGLALLLGIGLRAAAVAGTTLLLTIRAVAPVPENNPVMDEHVIYALILFGLVVVRAGDRWGFGARWRASRLVERFPFLA